MLGRILLFSSSNEEKTRTSVFRCIAAVSDIRGVSLDIGQFYPARSP